MASTLKLWDVTCSCGLRSTARKTKAEADKLAADHRSHNHDNNQATTVRELTVQLDDRGLVVLPVVVTS